MKKLFARFWNENDGVLAFEWVLLNSVLVLGAVAGVASVRDAINDEMADMTEAITSLDQSYVIQAPCSVNVGRTVRLGGGSIRGQIDEGRGYSSKAWSEFLNNNPDYSPAQTGGPLSSLGGASGAAGSLFVDHKPVIDRNAETGMAPPVEDQSGMIENVQ